MDSSAPSLNTGLSVLESSQVERRLRERFEDGYESVLRSMSGLTRRAILLRVNTMAGDILFDGTHEEVSVLPWQRSICLSEAHEELSAVRKGDHVVVECGIHDEGSKIREVKDNQIITTSTSKWSRDLGDLSWCIIRPISASEKTIRNLCKKYDITPAVEGFDRPRNKGKLQKAIAQYFRRPFSDAIDMILFASLGIEDLMGWRIEHKDPADIIEAICLEIYGDGIHRKSQRRSMKNTLLRALADRSRMLSLDFHLSPDFPSSLLRIPHD